MMRGSPEKQTVNPQEVDKGRRRLLAGAATLAGTGAVIAALSPIEKAYAAIEATASFPDRSKRTSLTHSAPNDTSVTLDISQGEPVTVQGTPTPDLQATKTALEIQSDQLTIQKQQTDNRFAFWTDVGTPVSVLITGVLGTTGYLYNRNKDRKDRFTQEENRRIEREKRDEDRFQEAVLALGKDETKLGAATTLRTFLGEKNKESYKRFNQQIFDLSVGFLRLRKVDQNNPEPDPFYREIIRLFCESTPRIREMLNLQTLSQSNVLKFYNKQRKFFNASHIHLENADLIETDLSLADLSLADLTGAGLIETDLTEANLTGANPEDASTLQSTNMWNVKNYDDPEKRQKCKDKGATFDPPPAAPKTKGETK
jgi:Pentapeptide repeats (8 copies)